MSILIKGMEMPKHCWQCKFHDDIDNCIIIGENCVEVWGEYRRLDSCPLIPVPDHGRLIDTSAKVQTQLYDDQIEEWIDADMTVEEYLGYCFNEVPTIIPASEEVYDKYTDTAVNIHWMGTHSGKHIIPADKEGDK